MSKRLLIGLLSGALALSLALPGAAVAKDKDKPDLVSGLFRTTSSIPTFYELTAKTDKNGGRGWFKWTNTTGEEWKDAIDCVVVDGDTAVMTGYTAWSSVPSQIGNPFGLIVSDGAASGQRDRFKRLSGFSQDCVDGYDDLLELFNTSSVPILLDGDISVRDR